MAYNMVSSTFIHAIETTYRDVKFTDADVNNHMDWAHDAERYAEHLLATGTATEFVVSILASRARWKSLTKGQYRGLMNMVRAEVLAADRTAEQLIKQIETGIEPLDLSKIPSGRYAVDEDDPKFYQIDNIQDEKDRFGNRNKWCGWVFASLKISDDRIKLGSQRPGQKYQGQHEENLRKIANDPLAAAQLYGRLIGECGICGRTLTDPDSIALGIGPICAEKLGMMGSPDLKHAATLLKKILSK
jgi:uncharacterized protein DUF6011